jgi:TRAP-type C4-dicarboxylate transport system substrate-binding protein
MSFTQTALKNVFTIVDLALLVDNPLAAQGAALETIFFDCPECIADFKRNNTVLLATYGLTPYVLMCNSDVKNLKDVHGKRVRTSGPNARWAKAMGGSPVGMSVADMIEGIQRGQIDCIIGPIAWITNYKIESHIKSVIDFPMGVFLGAAHAVLSRNTWKNFSAAEQQAILRAAPKSTSGITLLGYYAESQKARASGQEFRELLTRSKAGEMAAVIGAAKKRGVRDPQKIIDTFLGKVDKWHKIIADAKIDIDNLDAAHATYSRILWENIYSKVDPAKM